MAPAPEPGDKGSMVLPAAHRQFLDRALPVLQHDDRLLGVAAAGSWITGTMDEYSDVDLVLVADPDRYEAVLAGRHHLAGRLGPLLAAFTGEHVGEPRLLICLYDAPLLHVDLKVVRVDDLAQRIEDPVVLWERERALTDAIAAAPARHPMPDPQWIEDRFWVWVHYAALRLGRGELFEVIDFLAYLRGTVLGPMALVRRGQLPRGVRRLELLLPDDLPDFRATVPAHDRASCGQAVLAAVHLYRRLRAESAAPALRENHAAETAALSYLQRVIDAA